MNYTFTHGYEALHNATEADSIIAIGRRAGYQNAHKKTILIGAGTTASQDGEVVIGNDGSETRLNVGNYQWEVDQDTTGLDNYVATFDIDKGEITLKSPLGSTNSIYFTDTDSTLTESDITPYRKVQIYAVATASQSGAMTITLPDASANLVGAEVIIYASDNSSGNVLVATSTATMRDGDSDVSSADMTTGTGDDAAWTMRCFQTGTSSYRWVINKSN